MDNKFITIAYSSKSKEAMHETDNIVSFDRIVILHKENIHSVINMKNSYDFHYELRLSHLKTLKDLIINSIMEKKSRSNKTIDKEYISKLINEHEYELLKNLLKSLEGSEQPNEIHTKISCYLYVLFGDVIIDFMARFFRINFTDDVKSLVSADLSKKWCLEKVSESLNICSITLKKKLHNEGVTFSELLLNLRMKAALKLLFQKKHSIKKISKIVGYNSQSYFSRAFKDFHGITPREFLKKYESID